jgi:hypothetical protein
MAEINALMRELCDAGAHALNHYATISGEDPCTAPEYLMPALICRELGDTIGEGGTQLSVTLETTFSTLWEWNSAARVRDLRSVPSELVKLGEKLGTQRVDMVLFSVQPGISKDDHDLFALVEFKRGNLEEEHGNKDREKLRGVLKYIDTCSYGVVCGWVESKYHPYQKERANRAGDSWFDSSVPVYEGKYVFCARVFTA